MSLFDTTEPGRERRSPLADRMRPQTLEEYVGQEHILGPGKPLRVRLERDEMLPLIPLFGATVEF